MLTPNLNCTNYNELKFLIGQNLHYSSMGGLHQSACQSQNEPLWNQHNGLISIKMYSTQKY